MVYNLNDWHYELIHLSLRKAIFFSAIIDFYHLDFGGEGGGFDWRACKCIFLLCTYNVAAFHLIPYKGTMELAFFNLLKGASNILEFPNRSLIHLILVLFIYFIKLKFAFSPKAELH